MAPMTSSGLTRDRQSSMAVATCDLRVSSVPLIIQIWVPRGISAKRCRFCTSLSERYGCESQYPHSGSASSVRASGYSPAERGSSPPLVR